MPGADWSGDAFAAWLDQVSPENPPRPPRVEPPPTPVDEALLARIKEALIGREALAENVRLSYLAEYEFDEKYAASLRGRKLPPEVETTWRLHFEWAFGPDGRRVDAGPADEEPLPWSEWRDARGEQRAPGPIPGFVRDLWDEPAGPTPLLRGYGGHTWSEWFDKADRIELETIERDGKPHHRLKLRRREEPMATYLELWLPADALSTPTALRYQRLDTEIGRSAVREVEFDGWRDSLPTGLRETQRTEWGEPRRELPEQVVIYTMTAPGGAADTR